MIIPQTYKGAKTTRSPEKLDTWVLYDKLFNIALRQRDRPYTMATWQRKVVTLQSGHTDVSKEHPLFPKNCSLIQFAGE